MSEKKEIYVSIRKKPWKDLQDNDYIYKEGDIYPREGLKVDKKRIKELASTKNKIGEILIEAVQIEDEEQENKSDSQQVDETGNNVNSNAEDAKKVEEETEKLEKVLSEEIKKEESETFTDKTKKE